MGIRSRSWGRGRTCDAIIELRTGQLFVCGKYTRDREGRCDEHRREERPLRDRGLGRERPRDGRRAS